MGRSVRPSLKATALLLIPSRMRDGSTWRSAVGKENQMGGLHEGGV